MKFNNVTPVAPAFLLCVGSPNAGGQVTLRIEKYEETNVVNHPSLEQYVRDTFSRVVSLSAGRTSSIFCDMATWKGEIA